MMKTNKNIHSLIYRRYSIHIISILCIIPLLSGCSGEYLAEKMFWYANRGYKEIVTSSKPKDKKEYDQVINKFQEIINTYPDWENTSVSQLLIARLYFHQKEFQNAQKEFQKVLTHYPTKVAICSEALFSIGMCKEKRGYWNSALKIYNEVHSKYEFTEYGLVVPLHIAQYYKDKKPSQAPAAYQKAIDYYLFIEGRRVHPKISESAEDLLLTCYINQKEWDKAIELLKFIHTISPNSERGRTALYRVANFYDEKIDNKVEALKVYKQFLNLYPHHHLSEGVTMRISSLKIIIPEK